MFEIRSYHYDPAKFDAYKAWAINDAAPWLKANLNVVGFWLDNGEKAELSGADPVEHKHGVANVTWIIRWDSRAQRDEQFGEVFTSKGWQEVWAKHPDPDGYLQMEARFTEEV